MKKKQKQNPKITVEHLEEVKGEFANLEEVARLIGQKLKPLSVPVRIAFLHSIIITLTGIKKEFEDELEASDG